MRVAIIGAGLQGTRRAQALKDMPGSELVVITARELCAAEPLAARMGCAGGAGWQEAVSRRDVEVVVICSPPDLHAPIALAALAEGKHVLCEKPLARTVAEAEAMVTAAEHRGVILKCGFNHRHHPAIAAAKQHLDTGKIGRPVFVRAVYGICGRPGYEKEWRADPAVVSGGQLMEQGIHVIDLFRWFLGDLRDVAATVETCYWPMAPLEDNAFVICRGMDGTPASLHSSLTQWKNLFSFEVYGDAGYVAAEGLGGGYGTEKLITGEAGFDRPFTCNTTEFRGADVSWREEWKTFTQAVRTGKPPMGDGRDGLEALGVVFAAYEAASTGDRVPLVREWTPAAST